MLDEFLAAHRAEILELARKRTRAEGGPERVAVRLERALPALYERLVSGDGRAAPPAAAQSDEIHGYRVLGQAAAQAAAALGAAASPGDFRDAARAVDAALAESLAALAAPADDLPDEEKKAGCLMHELRGALAAALTAQALIREGSAAPRGPTSDVLERGLRRMRDILDGPLVRVRLQSEPEAERKRTRLLDVLGEVEASSVAEAAAKRILLTVDADPGLEVEADPQYLVAALSNLTQSAIDHTEAGGAIALRATRDGENAVIEIEDGCGGLPPGRADELLKPSGAEHAGISLGLAVARASAALNGGSLSVRDLPGKGCAFVLTVPAPPVPQPARVHARAGRKIKSSGRPS